MAKRKYAKMSDPMPDNPKYECTKRKCKWQGTYKEKADKEIEPGHSEKICPNCGNNEFYTLL